MTSGTLSLWDGSLGAIFRGASGWCATHGIETVSTRYDGASCSLVIAVHLRDGKLRMEAIDARTIRALHRSWRTEYLLRTVASLADVPPGAVEALIDEWRAKDNKEANSDQELTRFGAVALEMMEVKT